MPSNQGNMPGTILVGLLLSLPLLALLPYLLLSAYKRALNRWMSGSVETDLEMETDLEPPESLPVESPPRPPSSAAPLLWRSVTRSRQLRSVLAYALAGAAAAAALTLGLIGEAGVHRPLAFLTIFSANLWPLVLAAGAIFGWRRKSWLRAVLVYFCFYGVFITLQRILGAKADIPHLILLFVLLNAPATVFYRAISLRRIRQVGPTLLPLSVAVIVGPQILLHLGSAHFTVALWIARFAIALRLTNLGGVVLSTLVTVLFMAFVGFAAAWLLASLYRARHLSDQMLLLDALWLLVVGTQALVLLTQTGQETGSGSLWVIAAFALYLLTLRLALAASRPPRSATVPPPSLLVLRAFALQQRAEAIFQPVTALWRYLGPVRLIGASDLANVTIEPGAFLTFISRRLGTLFIRSLPQFETRMTQQSSTPDPDGRFRIDDFFCFKNTWKPAVSRLIRRSDVLLVDFRGLAQAPRAGCEWEIQEIVRAGLLARCVFLLEGPADDDSLHSLLATLASARPPAPHILHPRPDLDQTIDQILQALVQSVEGIVVADSLPPSHHGQS